MSNLKLVYLKDVADSQTGPFGSQLHQSDYVSEGTPMVTVEHLGIERFTHQNLPFVSDKDRDRLSKYILNEGDIVFSRVGSVDRCTYVTKEEDGWMFSGRCIRVRANEKANGRFLNFYFRQDSFKKMMLDISVGATMPSLNTKLMDNIPLRLPNYQTQQKIAKVLSDLDTKIELNNKINAELEAMAKTFYDYWFVQFDFPDANGKPYKSSGGKMVWNAELKREIPEGWAVVRVEDLLSKEISTKKIPSSEILIKGKIPVIDQSTDYIAGFTNNDEAIIMAKQPRIIFGDHTRVVKLINFDFAKGADGTQVLLSNNKRNPQHLFYHSILKIDLSNYGYARHFKFLKDSKMILPEEKVANEYESIVSSFFEKIKANIFQNQELASLRDWLLPMLMNGQVSVGDSNISIEEKTKQLKDLLDKFIEYPDHEEKLGMVAEENVEYKRN
jgi:type I restriction enzyme S subunit